MDNYDLLMPGRIVFGWGRRREVGAAAQALGRRVFLFWGSRTIAAGTLGQQVRDSLLAAGLDLVEVGPISREPEVEDVDRATDLLREQGAGQGDVVVAVGGGSAIDLAKAAAALATNTASAAVPDSTVRDYLEGVGRGLEISRTPLPMIALPTTAGTGSEATKNAVISCYDPPFKKSLRADAMIPRVAIVDPELTVALPPAATAYTGMDAITHLIESYLSRRARPVPQALALESLPRAMQAIGEAVRDGTSHPAREAMAHAALLSGIALANSGLGLAHGVAAALGAHCRVTHGLACAVMLPVALRVNQATCERALAELEAACDGYGHRSDAAAAESFIVRIEQLCADLKIPRQISDLGLRREQIPQLVAGSHGNSLSGNPRTLGDEELADILEEHL